ncbi:MAG: hypothetical protein SFU83_04220 [Meiothermus sp.]|nr:hypothetical protein [Meiothermus sp.]
MKTLWNQALVIGAMLVGTAALAQADWKTFTDQSNSRCSLSVPADWNRKQGELFIRDSSQQVKIMLLSSMNNLTTARKQVSDTFERNRYSLIRETSDSVLYRYEADSPSLGRYVGFYALIGYSGGNCKMHMMVPAALAPRFESLFPRIAGTLKAR